MIKIDDQLRQVIKRCQGSPSFFLDTFGRVQHPSLGITKFNLFSYQKKCLASFVDNRFTIFKKTRQSGISTLTGAYALWKAMFTPEQTILIVSKRDDDAMDFLRKNVATIYEYLPDWMHELWPKVISNAHEISFPNGSRIKSLTSSRDTLRSQAASLNIIDEAAFIEGMDEMWAAGAPSIMHGGKMICISTTKGIGNWYWQTWTDAENGHNDFVPIKIDWWDMDWRLEWQDNDKKIVLAPTDGIRECKTKDEIEKYGPYWSPWLETQYRLLTEKGDSRKFKQEVLCEFLGTGDTVLSYQALKQIEASVQRSDRDGPKFRTVGHVPYVNPMTDERAELDFNNHLWVWKEPFLGKAGDKDKGIPDEPPHQYVVGADPSSGDGNDYSGVEVFDLNTSEQVAELQIRAEPRSFAYMVDFIGRWYNNAFLVVERTGLGIGVCQDLEGLLMYQNMYRKPKKNAFTKASKYGDVGFTTSHSSKPILTKALIDFVGTVDEEGHSSGMVIRSSRLYKEALIFVHLKNSRVGAEPGIGNHDDLIMATALAMMGSNQAVTLGSSTLIPVRAVDFKPELHNSDAMFEHLKKYATDNGINALFPVFQGTEDIQGPITVRQELDKFAKQLGTRPAVPNVVQPTVHQKKHIITYHKNKRPSSPGAP